MLALLRGVRVALIDLAVFFTFLNWGNVASMRETGFLSAYDQAPTDATLAYRFGENVDLSAYDGFVAVRDCGRIGETAELETIAGTFDVLIFDCAGGADGGLQWMIEGGYVAEIDYYLREAYPELVGSIATIRYRTNSLPSRLKSFLVERFPLNVRNAPSEYTNIAPGADFAGKESFKWPYEEKPAITQHYHRSHRATDVALGCRTPLIAPISGIVTYNGSDGYIGPYSDGVTNTMLRIDGRLSVVLLHGAYLPAVGSWMRQGELIGYESNIGNVIGPTGCHSHVIVYDQAGNILDPESLIK